MVLAVDFFNLLVLNPKSVQLLIEQMLGHLAVGFPPQKGGKREREKRQGGLRGERENEK